MCSSEQEADCKSSRVNRVVFLGNLKRVLTTGVSRWNTRQIALWDQVGSKLFKATRPTRISNQSPSGICWNLQEDLCAPITEEEIDGLSGVLFPFYDADTHMLYLAGKVSTSPLKQSESCRTVGHLTVEMLSHPQGDGNIRYYEVSAEKPFLQFLMEFRSPAPQKGLGECLSLNQPRFWMQYQSSISRQKIKC